MKAFIASALVAAVVISTQALGQVDDRTLVTTTTSQENPLRVNFTVPSRMNAEVHLYSEHCGQASPKSVSVTAQIYDTSGAKIGDEIKIDRPVGGGQQEITESKPVTLDPGSYYVTVESHSEGARFVKQGVNISTPGTFNKWNYVALAC